MTIGIIVAVEGELLALLQSDNIKCLKLEETPFPIYFFETKKGVRVYVAHSSAGQIDAALATQILIMKYGAEYILNYGVVGALAPDINVGELLVVARVVKHDYDTSAIDNIPRGQYYGMGDRYFYPTEKLTHLIDYSNCRPATLASGDQFIATPEEKRMLHIDFNADICDMEGAAIARTCFKYNVGFLMVKCISDSLEGGAVQEFGQYVKECGLKAFKFLLDIMDKIQ